MKKLTCILLAVVMLLSAIPVSAGAASNQNTTDGIFYGVIRVLADGTSEPEPYRAARDQEGNVYIHLGDYAKILGARLEEGAKSDVFCYRFGNWNLVVFCREKSAKLYYNPGGDPYTNGLPIYGVFSLEKLIYRRAEKSWYLPMEEMLYMSLCQWSCTDGFVAVYRPENLLDVMSDLQVASSQNPGYEDLMGEDGWEQVGNSFKYGFLAGADEIDATFIADSFLIGIQVKDTTTYEDELLKDMLVLLSDDSPYENEDESIRQVGSDTFAGMSSFASNASAAMTLFDPEKQTAAAQLLADMLGNPLTKAEIAEISQATKSLGNSVALAEQTTDFVFSIANSLWTRDYLPENFGDRLLFLQEVTANDKENDFGKQLNKAAESAYSEYYGDIGDAIHENVSLNHIIGTVDAISGMMGGISLLNTPMMMLSMYDFAVETAKSTVPAIGEAFDTADDARATLHLLNLYSYMASYSNQSIQKLAGTTGGIDQDYLDTHRLSCQIAQNAAMHAHAKLLDMGKMQGTSFTAGTELLQRLTASAKHDGVLTITNDFANLHSDTAGAIRQQIPPEYVYGGDGIFLSPVYQRTDVPAGYTAIETEEDLLAVERDLSGKYILMADLEFNDWTPLGSGSSPFTGIFDGNGHSITINFNKTVTLENEVHGGIFEYMDGNAVVKNVHIKGDWQYVYDDTSSAFDETCIGSICTYIQGNATVFNCVNSANISCDTPSYRYNTSNYIGGLVSYGSPDPQDNVRISYCRNMGKIQGKNYVAGIVCIAYDATIYACQNDGTILSDYTAGGIANTSTGYIRSCANRGEVNGEDNSGAIADYAEHIEDCINVGIIYTEGAPVGYSGGIVGISDGTVIDCVNIGDAGHLGGGIVGNFKAGGSIENSYWIESEEQLFANADMAQTVNGIDRQTGMLTAGEMTDPDSFEGFDFISTWTLYEGMSCPYPSALLLNGQTPPMPELEGAPAGG